MRKQLVLSFLLSITINNILSLTKEEFLNFMKAPNSVEAFYNQHRPVIIERQKRISIMQRLTKEERTKLRNHEFFKHYTIYPCFNYILKSGIETVALQIAARELLNSTKMAQCLRFADTYVYSINDESNELVQGNYVVIIEKLHRMKSKVRLDIQLAESLVDLFLLLNIRPYEISYSPEENKILILRLPMKDEKQKTLTQKRIIEAVIRIHKPMRHYAEDVRWSNEAYEYLQTLKKNPPTKDSLLAKYNLTEHDLALPDIAPLFPQVTQ